MPRFALTLLLAAFGCGRERAPAVPVPVPAPALAPAPAPAGETSPAALYASCEPYVEGPQSDGECRADGDCARAGCGLVVCTTATSATDLMTTCEDRPCYAVLDTCGCHDGRCTWTVRAEPAPPP
jgi:eight-cysteine-cluster-containing protein